MTVTPCDARGRVKAGTAPSRRRRGWSPASELEDIRKRIVAKYGLMTKLTKLLGTIAGVVRGKRIPYGDRGVVITLAPAA